MIRNVTEEDLKELKVIHERFFAEEFRFDDFLLGSMSNFVVTDSVSNKILTGASIRPIAEVVAITDLDAPVRQRVNALYDILQVSNFVLRGTEMYQLHAFVQDEIWEKQLIKAGFKRTIGNALYINI